MNEEIDDGSDKPEGYVTPDGELIVIGGEYHETELGQVQRWMRQAPDLYEKFLGLTTAKVEVEGGGVSDWDLGNKVGYDKGFSKGYDAGRSQGLKEGAKRERRYTRKVLREYLSRPPADALAAIRGWLVRYSLAKRTKPLEGKRP